MVSPAHAAVVDDLLADVSASYDEVLASGTRSENSGRYA
jgi:hypothetical protein